MYTTESFTASISVSDYMENYVDIPTFMEYCKACSNYGRLWSCPPYDFDAEAYWRQFQTLDLLAVKITFDLDYAGQSFTPEQLNEIYDQSMKIEKERLSEILHKKENEYTHAISLSAGSCTCCHDGCTRCSGQTCRYPDQLRYSIESLGGNVGLTLSRCMGIELEWIEEGRLPTYFVLVSGLLHD